MLTEDVESTSSMNEKHFLSAEDLVSLRKPAEEPATSIMCGKFYSPSDPRFEGAMVEHVLEINTDKLSRKRGAKICDLMQADWNEELNVSMASKLKGKFLQHIGRNVNGKIVLSPEESLFLLENGCIEIMNGAIPMSTEEGYSVMLKGNNSIECYQVYSHLSNQGYRVVPHQAELGITKYEKSVAVNKRKRRTPLAAVGEPEQKRLTFSGAFPSDHDDSSSDTEIKDMSALPAFNNTIDSKNDDQENAGASHLNTLVNNEISYKEIENEESQSKGEAEVDQNEEAGNPSITVNDSHEGEKEKTEPHYVVDVTSSQSNNNKQDEDQIKESSEQDRDCIDQRPLICVCNRKEISDDQSKEPAICVMCNGQVKPSEPENTAAPGTCPDSTASVSHPNNDIDVMDVDSQSTEVSCSTSEISKPNLETDAENVNLNNHTSNNSHSSVMNDVAEVVKDTNVDSNLDVMSCSSSDSSESDVLSLEASNDSMLDPCEDDVTLLEVTRKETKPLAVIDLISDDDDEEDDVPPALKGDDEITVVKVCSGPSTTINTNVSTSRKFYNCKKEERASPTVPTHSYPSLTVQFPDLFRKDVVCLSRPPLNLLPSHVKPSKEVYVLDLKQQKSDQFSAPPQGRVWNSYRDMQDYQRARRQNRHGGQSFSQFQNREHNNWGNIDFGTSGRQRDQKNMYAPQMPDLPARNANGRDNYNHTGDNGNLSRRSFGGSSPFHPGAPPTASMNSVVSIRQQDMNVSLLGNPPFPALNSNNALPPVQFPPNMSNFANMGPAQIMAEVQRTAYSVATSMLSSMLGRGHPGLPNSHFSQFNAFQPPQSNFNYDLSNTYDASGTPGYNAAFNNNQSRNGEHFPMQNRRNFRDSAPRGRPFPCQYSNIPHKRSWGDVKAAVGDVAQENGSDIEEVPINPRDILWDESNICPLVKPGFRHGPSAVLNMFSITQPAKLREECWSGSRYLPTTCSLEISYDVYPPGFNYKKTAPDIPKYRIVVCRSTDPVPSFSEVTLLQRKWKDGAQLLFAVVDNGDISFQSFNNICLPVTVPHEE